MHERIAEALLIHTGYAISALVSLGEGGEILLVSLFDTLWQAEAMQIDPAAARFLLISHHPQGETAPYDADIENLLTLRRMAGGRGVRLYVASEYFACRQINL